MEAGDNGSVRLDLDNEPQPDAYLIIRPEHGGQARISEDDYIEGAPELVAEVAASSASYDLGKKLARLPAQRRPRVRRLAGPRSPGRLVREPRRVIRADRSRRPTASCAARCFPASGSTRPPLMRGDVNGVLAVVQQGLNSPEHAEFVARLERDRTS